jgi:hypothetical protein
VNALKEPERITLAEGLTILERHVSIEQAKICLREAFTRKAFPQSPTFTFEYDEANIDWATGLVKIPRMRDRFCPSFLRADFERYFFRDHMAEEPLKMPAAVFIVHGHDEAPRDSVARFIEKLGFEAIILHERPNKGRTIITKFREESVGVGFAVVLMTPDDLGKAKEDTDLKHRARQNVIFELGFFIGALRPEHVAALVKGDIDLPSDYDGVVYISMDKEDWRNKLAKELEAANYHIDWNKVMRS